MKYIIIICIGFFMLLSLNHVSLMALDEDLTQKADELAKQKEQLNTQIQEKTKLANDLFSEAQQLQESGDYDQAYTKAEKAKNTVEEVKGLKGQLAKVLQEEKKVADEKKKRAEKRAEEKRRAEELERKRANAENRIQEAKALIAKAEEQEGDKWAPEELASSKSSLLSSENEYEQKKYDESYKLASDSVNYANMCLQKITEAKKQQEAAALKQSEDISVKHKYVQKGNYLIWTNYTVRLIPERRDCLWRIAEYQFIYNNPWKWPIIYKANKKVIGTNPHLIFPGQIFDIPALDEQGNPLMPETKPVEGTTTEEGQPTEKSEEEGL